MTTKNIKREPSCILNHEKLRQELAEKDMPPIQCPECNWIIFPKKVYEDDATMADCITCGQKKLICCGDEWNGYQCPDCCLHLYSWDGDLIENDEDDSEGQRTDQKGQRYEKKNKKI